MKEILILGAIIGIVIIGAVVGSKYYNSSTETTRTAAPGVSEAMVRPDSPTVGPADAKVTVVEFLDPECESCAAFGPTVKKLQKDYDPKVRLVIRYMPLHPNSVPAATFLEAAGEQGKFWQALELLFEKQPEWGTVHGAPASAPKPDVPKLLEQYTMQLGLDVNKFTEALKQNKYSAKLERDRRDGQTLGVRQTPTIFVNGRRLMRLDGAELKSMIDQELAK